MCCKHSLSVFTAFKREIDGASRGLAEAGGSVGGQEGRSVAGGSVGGRRDGRGAGGAVGGRRGFGPTGSERESDARETLSSSRR